MKKVLLNLAFVAIVAALASCKKDNASAVIVSDANVYNSESVSQNVEGQYRGVPYTYVLENLEEEYGCCFDFSDATSPVTSSSGSNSAVLFAFPSTWFDDVYLTVVISSSGQLLGVFQVEFTSGFSKEANRDIEVNSYEYDIWNQYGGSILFHGYTYMNVPYYPDRIYISNYPGLNSYNFPYPLFDYISTGYTNLENYTDSGIGVYTPMNPKKMALRLASTFYIHFYLGN